jgi:hypothetical protein
MKRYLTLVFFLILSNIHQGQTHPKTSIIRLQAGANVCSYGYRIGYEKERKSPGMTYLTAMPKVQLSLKLNRKNEFFTDFESKTLRVNVDNVRPEIDGFYTYFDLKSSFKNIDYKIFSFGFRHFINANVSPAGSYYGFSATLNKVTASPLAYTYLDNNLQTISGQMDALDFIIPSLTISGGKRIFLSDKIYFNNEFLFSVNTYTGQKFEQITYKEKSWYHANRLTNFAYTFSLGIVL